jgi:hypothetical protein
VEAVEALRWSRLSCSVLPGGLMLGWISFAKHCNSDGDSLSEEAVQKQHGHLQAKMLWLWKCTVALESFVFVVSA